MKEKAQQKELRPNNHETSETSEPKNQEHKGVRSLSRLNTMREEYSRIEQQANRIDAR